MNHYTSAKQMQLSISAEEALKVYTNYVIWSFVRILSHHLRIQPIQIDLY